MKTFIRLYSNENNEISRFLEHYYSSKKISVDSKLLEWEQTFENPIEMAEIIGVFIDNIDDYKINMWVCLDKNILINVTKNNVDDIIRYLYERFPY